MEEHGGIKGHDEIPGDEAEDKALAYLQGQDLAPVQRNYRVAQGPGARGAEVDLIMRTPDGTLVFVKVRQRSKADHGGAAATVSRVKQLKQRRCIWAARYCHHLMGLPKLPPCRFDLVAVDGDELNWLPAAFEADASLIIGPTCQIRI